MSARPAAPYRTSMPTAAARSYPHVTRPGAAADRLEREAAPEVVPVADLVGLAAEHEDPAEPWLAHPHHGGLGPAHEVLREVGVGRPSVTRMRSSRYWSSV